jgi:hypothetical protein
MILKTDLSGIKAAHEMAFRRALDEVVGLAKDNAPVSVSRGLKLNAGSVQGGLRASIAADPPVRDATGLKSRVGSPLRYAMMREKGGTILPVRGRFLSWIDPITGERIFAKRVVQLPGGARNGHRPWLQPAGDQFPKIMGEHLAAIP